MGLKFKISPVIFEKKINFSEYRGFIFPLTYLADQSVISNIKKCDSFNERVNIANNYFSAIVQKYEGSTHAINIVTAILERCNNSNDFTSSIESFADEYKISTRTLQRHFEKTTSISSKKALQIMRVRKAVQHLGYTPKRLSFFPIWLL